MRLINVESPERLYFEDFNEPNVPEYAILSHTWGDEEVTYKDFCDACWSVGGGYSTYTHGRPWLDPLLVRGKRAGFEKVLDYAEKARDYQLKYVWIDTCTWSL
jgi:hypothetical protein